MPKQCQRVKLVPPRETNPFAFLLARPSACRPLCSVQPRQQSPPPQAQAAESRTSPDAWWKHAVIYEVYPRSFQDTNRDGIGDIKGIESRLHYLKSLGIDAIWITPMYPSPQVDFGYDIADYEAIDPQYGTMGDFDTLLKTAKAQGIRVIMDVVLNPYLGPASMVQGVALVSRNNPKRDWYIWRDGAPARDGKPRATPTTGRAWFGHSAWQMDPATGQYYYHYFYRQQPDLNWRNPEVRKAMFDVLRFWLDKGVSGFRMDAVSRLLEDPETCGMILICLGITPLAIATSSTSTPTTYRKTMRSFKEIRKLVDSYPSISLCLIAEADEPDIAER